MSEPHIDGRVVVAWHRFGPYHHARLKAAARRLPILGLEASTVDKVNAWTPIEGQLGFEKRTLFPSQDVDAASADEIRRTIDKVLGNYDVSALAIHGWSDRIALMLLEWATKRQVPAIMMSDSKRPGFERSWVKERIKRRVLKQCGAALAGGTEAAQYLEALGISAEQVFVGYDAVDNHYFACGADAARQQASQAFDALRLPERFFLASSRFVEEKNLPNLLEAFAIFRAKSNSQAWKLVIIGDGELRGKLELRRAELALEQSVLMPGFKQYEELPAYYGLASVFVLTSISETWGLVVNEAMASGLPVIVSKQCGCAADLVRDGINGYTFDAHSIEELASIMLKVVSENCDLKAMGRAGKEIMKQWGPERFAEGLVRAVEAASAADRVKATWFDRLMLQALTNR